VRHPIRLRGISGDIKGRTWESDSLLRAGRLAALEIVLDDSSVSRRHAEVSNTEEGWVVRDLGSTNGTYVNGVRLGQQPHLLRPRDIVQFGKIALLVESADADSSNGSSNGHGTPVVPMTEPRQQVVVEATSSSSWEEALSGIAFDRKRSLRPGDQLQAVLRAGHHLVHIETEDELLHSILTDAVNVLDAQRGAIVLADERDNHRLKIRALASGRHGDNTRFHYSQKLAQRCFSKGESILCGRVEEDTELKAAPSIADGAMASVLCVLLRTPRKRLGVLHLDRNLLQKPFTEDDLHLADALAASVSAGIETAGLLRKQRELFLHTITILAQAVELRDEYTGGHTERVKNYAMCLGRQMGLSPRELGLIEIGTPLHDIGKIGIDDAILRKPGRLTPEEFEIMKTHTTKGADIIATIPDLHPILPIVRSHHERWDGRGYPDGLAGENIPLLARIVAVCDAFDAMTSDRPYHPDKKGRSPQAAFHEIEQQMALQFDPRCAAAFLEIQNDIVQSMTNAGKPTHHNNLTRLTI
jgi:HD-GYP domain-containing protein (c-di-GMP phosphodiesterase class II)/pSer/pThr/pTyr-binding forkhead associated (FHA) protein